MTARDLYSDLHKDVYGVRPGRIEMVRVNEMSDEEFDAHWGHLIVELDDVMETDKRREAKARIDFDTKLNLISSAYSISSYDAMRWLADAEDIVLDTAYDQDVEHFFWRQGLGWGDIKHFVAEVDRNKPQAA